MQGDITCQMFQLSPLLPRDKRFSQGERNNVLLLAHNLPDNLSLGENLIIIYEIKSQGTKQGKLHSARETLNPNGSLMLQNVTLKQSGVYSLNIHSAELDQKSTLVEVRIYHCLLNQNWTSPKLETTSRPSYNLHSSPQEQAETSTEKLFCLLSENLPKPHIQIRNKTVPERHFVALACVLENPRVSIR
ncbi:hypothetical protein U0070_018267 [Myodes glareolus]|uniref:Uncharacterized protein n=1 Tax=Myodes glareolus TaxID=447135 RepID=A0AAW0H6K2_MYOGA